MQEARSVENKEDKKNDCLSLTNRIPLCKISLGNDHCTSHFFSTPLAKLARGGKLFQEPYLSLFLWNLSTKQGSCAK